MGGQRVWENPWRSVEARSLNWRNNGKPALLLLQLLQNTSFIQEHEDSLPSYRSDMIHCTRGPLATVRKNLVISQQSRLLSCLRGHSSLPAHSSSHSSSCTSRRKFSVDRVSSQLSKRKYFRVLVFLSSRTFIRLGLSRHMLNLNENVCIFVYCYRFLCFHKRKFPSTLPSKEGSTL